MLRIVHCVSYLDLVLLMMLVIFVKVKLMSNLLKLFILLVLILSLILSLMLLLLLLGAATVLYPVWSGAAQAGVGILASQVFLIRFYTELPFHSADKRSIVTACRRTQLWLRDVTGDKTIEFLNQTPIPKRARDELIQEMNRFIEASVAPGTPYYDPNITPGNTIIIIIIII